MKISFMDKALEKAYEAINKDEVPVGAVLVHNNQIIAAAHNCVERDKDPTAHAEILVLRMGAQHLGQTKLSECDLYVTLEPCTMCAGAIAHARIKKLFYGAYDIKGGAIDHGVQFFQKKTCFHQPEVIGGIQEEACSKILCDFFRDKR